MKENTPFDFDTFLQTERSWLTLFFQVSSSPISNWDYILIKSSSLLIPSGKLARTISIFFYRLRSLVGLSLFYFWSFWIFDWTATKDLPSSFATYLILLAEIVAPHSMALLRTSTSFLDHNFLCLASSSSSLGPNSTIIITGSCFSFYFSFLKTLRVYKGEHFSIYRIILRKPSIHQQNISLNSSVLSFFFLNFSISSW